MDVGTAMSVVQTLMAALQCPQLKELFPVGYKFQLEKLEVALDEIKGLLKYAEEKQVPITDNLKDLLDEADNLFDEFVTRAERIKHSKETIKGRLLSVFSGFGLACQLSQKANEVKTKLDNIACNKQFYFKLDHVPIPKKNRETGSYAPEEIIGRKDDLEAVMGMLLDADVGSRDVSFLSIVGIGGLGKTALAQQVYHHPRVETAFPLRMWTCVSDEGQKELNVNDVLCRILGEESEGCTLDKVQGKLQNKLEGQKYLLVLDDVWTENRNQWGDLVGHLKKGGRGSWIVVTTRSQKTAKLEHGGRVHKLPGLSPENSWRLLKRKAFGSEDSIQPEELVKIGLVIVKKCAYVPLAIKVVGSLLYDQSKDTWQSFQKYGLANINEKNDDIMPILKISYNQLDSQLKSCFSYCALFPKDEEIEKETLIQLWIAQGYITSSGRKSMEEVAEEYVLILIDRGFFQDVSIKEDDNEIEWFKMHDLMHDVAQEVAKKEICRVHSFDGDKHNKVRHISLVQSEDAKKLTFAGKTPLRTFLLDWSMGHVIDHGSVDALLKNCKFLRALDLSDLDITSLPESIGELLHLRYLDVSDYYYLEVLPRKITRLYNLQVLKLRRWFKLKELPKEISRLDKLRVLDIEDCNALTHLPNITKLYNLRVLKLCYCAQLTELPKDMSKLDKLRVLDIEGCNNLNQMPRSIGELKCLHTLGYFVLKEVSSSKELLDAIEVLKGLVNLKGSLELDIKLSRNGSEFEKESGREGGYLRNKEYLNSVDISLDFFVDETTRLKCLEALMEELQPHHNLKKLRLEYYKGERMPRWAREDTLIDFLPNLVSLSLNSCEELKTLECLGNLPHLEYLQLNQLHNLEFTREKADPATSSNMTATSGASSSSTSHGFSFFPSLKELYFCYLPNLQTWGNDELLCLPQLKILTIIKCPSLVVILQCPLLENLVLNGFNSRLQIVTEKMMKTKELEDVKGKGKEANISELRKVEISCVEWLKLLSIGENRDKQVKNLEDVFHVSSNSLQILSISSCRNLTSVSGGPEHLAALEKLSINFCPNLEREEGIGMPWPSLGHSLHTLELDDLPQLVSLPDQMQYLTSLQILTLKECERLKSLPNWMKELTSLKYLRISKCSTTLHERCQGSTGQDWPHIAHIPSVDNSPRRLKQREWVKWESE